MDDPDLQPIGNNSWYKAATDVTSGFIHIIGGPGRYVFTYRDTGNPAPDDITDREEGVSFDNDGTLAISASAGIDVYIMYLGDNTGRIRIDL